MILGDKEKSQVDMYDIFGYLVPGFILCVAVSIGLLFWHGTDFNKLKSIVDLDAGEFVALSIFVLTVSYIVGHVIATLSESIFDRIFVKKIFGYPYENLMFGRVKPDRRSSLTKNFYRTAITIFYLAGVVIIVLPSMRDVLFIIGIDKGAILKFLIYLVFILFLLKLIERWGSKFDWEDFTNRNVFYRVMLYPLKVAQNIFIDFLDLTGKPFFILESFIRNTLGLDSKLPDPLVKKFKDKFKSEFGLDVSRDIGSEIYWLTYWYVTERSVHMRSRLYKFLSLYGLTRNASVAMYLAAVVISAPAYFKDVGFHFIILSLILLISSFAMSVRFYYLYYNYYSKSVFRAFVVLQDEPTTNIIFASGGSELPNKSSGSKGL